ncbi:MAG: hypothetical protein KDC73_11100 [Ignavibacteriae bacterium]|nr:hypothetical protein [Ignavibacteriota bacterium]MCB0725237.1 hypothetical protein [Ignavibacteriota bacterium]MCB9242439.1 hypothetical protein [Ignavibacteriales bacterium]
MKFLFFCSLFGMIVVGINVNSQTIYLEHLYKYENDIYQYVYGYYSERDTIIPPGNQNYFEGTNADVGQPVVFKKGYHKAVFIYVGTGPNIRWFLLEIPEDRSKTKRNFHF